MLKFFGYCMQKQVPSRTASRNFRIFRHKPIAKKIAKV